MRTIVAWIAAAVVTAASQKAPVMPGPRPTRAPAYDAAAVNATCEKCHVDIAREWRGSLHRASATDPMYVRAFAREPLDFCAGCHQPEKSASIGVGCVTCHVIGDDILAAPGARAAPHAVKRDPAFASDAACASCHEFRYPNAPATSEWPGDFMQSTIREHARSNDRRACASCHMKNRSHSFAASRDANLIRSAATVTASRTSRSRLRVVVAPNEIGHAFPTGDLFRRVAIQAEARDEAGNLRAKDVVFLARHSPQQPRRPGELADDRVDDPRTVYLDLEGANDLDDVAWRVVYQRVEHHTSTDERDAVVEGEIVVASGMLRPDRKAAR